MKRAARRFHGVRVGPEERALLQRLHVELGGGAHTFSETLREAAVVFAAFLLGEKPPAITYQRERRRRQQLQQRLLSRAAAVSSGSASTAFCPRSQDREHCGHHSCCWCRATNTGSIPLDSEDFAHGGPAVAGPDAALGWGVLPRRTPIGGGL